MMLRSTRGRSAVTMVAVLMACLVWTAHAQQVISRAVFSGGAVRPRPAETTAVGLGVITLNVAERSAHCRIMHTLQQPVGSAIHAPADFMGLWDATQIFHSAWSPMNEQFDSTQISDTEFHAMRVGHGYITVQTDRYVEGEIRGQFTSTYCALAMPVSAWMESGTKHLLMAGDVSATTCTLHLYIMHDLSEAVTISMDIQAVNTTQQTLSFTPLNAPLSELNVQLNQTLCQTMLMASNSTVVTVNALANSGFAMSAPVVIGDCDPMAPPSAAVSLQTSAAVALLVLATALLSVTM